MDEALAKELLKTANQSGFPFQIGVRKEIERTEGEHGWKIVAEEHAWIHPSGGRSGFIDLIAEHKPFFFSLVIECKRVKAKTAGQRPSWIFLTPSDYTGTQHRLSGFMTHRLHDDRESETAKKPQRDLWGWSDWIDFDPPTLEASYCLFESQDEKNPTIERIADVLLPSVEAAGREWLTHRDNCPGLRRVFLPVIVTNATLYTCTFDAATISMADGGLPVGEFQEVPFVRFRKGLAISQPSEVTGRDFADANQRQQRSLLIANSSSLAGMLKSLRHTDRGKATLWNAFQGLNPPQID